jgi:putative membrane protein
MIADLLAIVYPWVKAFHIMAVISWMAGLFYLPRLFVYHAERVQTGTETDELFQTMELKLLKFIMNNAMIAAWIAGIIMAVTPGIIDWSAVWPYTKLLSVIGMTWFHMWLAARRKDFERGENVLNGRRYRMMNEVPTLLMIVIVVSVIVRPF